MNTATETLPASPLSFRYQQQGTTQTLREGLAEMRQAHPELLDPEDMPGDMGKFFKAHDRIHILFGTDTSVPNEAMTDTWTLAGTDATLRDLLDYYKQEDQAKVLNDLLKEIGYLRLIGGTLRSIPKVIRVIWNARKMTRKWPLYDNDRYLDTPLAELRDEFNIRVVH